MRQRRRPGRAVAPRPDRPVCDRALCTSDLIFGLSRCAVRRLHISEAILRFTPSYTKNFERPQNKSEVTL